MEGRQIVLNDGTVIPNGEAGQSGGFLWVYFTGYTMQQAASLFFDAEKTRRILFDYGDMQDVFLDFTNCMSINTDADGRMSVCMAKGAA